MKYNPENELTEEQITELPEDQFFEYIDSKAAYLKQFTRPLETYHTKRFAGVTAASQGRNITNSEIASAKKIGKDNFKKRMEAEAKASKELGGDPKYKDLGIKHFKTNRSQWFD
jgi:hypothetical protein